MIAHRVIIGPESDAFYREYAAYVALILFVTWGITSVVMYVQVQILKRRKYKVNAFL